MTTESTEAERSLVALVDAYGRRITPAFLDQHDTGNAVASPLGVWLLLAACSGAASGQDLIELEDTLGCSAADALGQLRRFLEEPPRALHSALALWVRQADHTTALVDWSASLPHQVERGPIPSQLHADEWADRHTAGLIPRFPLDLTPLTRVVLSSALATRVSWATPFEVVPAAFYLGESSPWRDVVENVLFEMHPASPTMLVETEAAGVVAAHFALANEDLAVMSVAADPSLPHQVVFEAASEVAGICRSDRVARATLSLYDLPLGRGHSWEITEHEVRGPAPKRRPEHIEGAVLVQWRAESTLDLLASGSFGVGPAISSLLGLIGPSPEGDLAQAVQSAVAHYTTSGFEAAALSVLTLLTGSSDWPDTPRDTHIERRATLYFDHPYAVVALAGTETDFRRVRLRHPDSYCLPLFCAWVAEPEEPDEPEDERDLS